MINIIEKEGVSKKIDSIVLNLKTNTNQIKVFLCGTGLRPIKDDYLSDNDDCFSLTSGLNKVRIFDSSNFHFRIYPNIDNALFRMNFDNIFTLYYKSKDFSKKMNSNLDININFDTQNFLNSSFDEEFAIINGKTIRFLGEDLVLADSKP